MAIGNIELPADYSLYCAGRLANGIRFSSILLSTIRSLERGASKAGL